MTRHGAILDLGRALADRHRILDLAQRQPLLHCVPGPADSTWAAQALPGFFVQNPARLRIEAAIDRFVAHTLLLVIGMPAHQPSRILLRRPSQPKLLGNVPAQGFVERELTGFGQSRAGIGWLPDRAQNNEEDRPHRRPQLGIHSGILQTVERDHAVDAWRRKLGAHRNGKRQSATDGATCDIKALAAHLLPYFANSMDAQVLLEGKRPQPVGINAVH